MNIKDIDTKRISGILMAISSAVEEFGEALIRMASAAQELAVVIELEEEEEE